MDKLPLHTVLKSTVLCATSDAILLDSTNAGTRVSFGEQGTLVFNADELAAIEVFSVARPLEHGVRALTPRLQDTAPAAALDVIMRLVGQGLIGPSGKRRTAASQPKRQGMFGCPHIELEQAVAEDAPKIIFLGMPYERGVTGRPGTASGPAYLRRSSRVAFDYTEKDSRALGWWHPERQKGVLEGVRFGDLGDIPCHDGQRNGASFDALYDTLRALHRAQRFPVLIGGDHSISLPAITAAASVHPGLTVLHFDAHSDVGAKADMGHWRRNCTHGNFMSWVVTNPNVASIYQVGIRHLLPERPHAPENMHTLGARITPKDIDKVIASLPPDKPCYVTFDVDCLDPAIVSQTGTPIPGGLTYVEVVSALQRLASARKIVGVDVVELISATDATNYREGIVVAYILFELLAHAFLYEPGAPNAESAAAPVPESAQYEPYDAS